MIVFPNCLLIYFLLVIGCGMVPLTLNHYYYPWFMLMGTDSEVF